MTAGDVDYEENLIVEVFSIKADEDIELGEVVFNDGNGILAASHSTTCRGPYFMACVNHDYSDADLYGDLYEDHDIPCLVTGVGDTQAYATAAIVKGRYVEVSTAVGEVTILDYTSSTGWYEVSGIAWDALASSTVTSHVKVLYGTFP